MTLKERIFDLLSEKPEARERKNRHRVLRYFVRKDIAGAKDLTDDTIDAIVTLGNSVDRLTRMLQLEDETMRGTDWEDREQLSQQKQIDLGYVPGIERDIKKLATLR